VPAPGDLPSASPEPPGQPPAASPPEPASTTVDPKLFAQVKELMAKGEREQAIKLVDGALAQAPSHAGLYELRGHLRTDRDQAISDYERAIALAPQFTAAHVNRINAKIALGKLEDAKAACDEFVRALPDLGLPYVTCGDVLVAGNKLAEAKAAFDTAIRKDPKLVVAFIGRGVVDLTMKQYDPALGYLSRAVELDGKSALAYGWRGRAYLANGEEKLAIADFRKSLAISRTLPAMTGLQALQVVKALTQLGQIK
jgi:tetratricopeptide (TPR) repeat protein